MTKNFSLGFLRCIPFALLMSCSTNPVTGDKNLSLISEQKEIQMGDQAAQEVAKEYTSYKFRGLQEYVNQVGQKLAAQSHRPNLQYTFTVVDSPEVNAFALPGGHIYITRGIMAYLNNEAELAGVLGHEIGHVTARHSVRQQSQSTLANIGAIVLGSVLESKVGIGGITDALGTGATAYVRGYGRDNELEADKLGAEYLARAGYNPQAMIRVVGVLKQQELFDTEVAKAEGREPRSYHGLFDTHPDADKRLKEVINAAGQPQTSTNDKQDVYLRAINGMIFGDNPEQGLLRKGTFYHPQLGFAISFPKEWKVQNQPDLIVAISKLKDAAIQMGVKEDAQGNIRDQLQQILKPDRVNQVNDITVNGLPAATMIATKGNQLYQATGIRLKNSLYIFVGLAKDANAFQKNKASFDQAINTFHTITANERKIAKAYIIRTVQTKSNDTFSSLAKTSPLENSPEQQLRMINQRYPAGEIKAGEIIKIIEHDKN